MKKENKTYQLQIRISESQKDVIKSVSKKSNMSMSEWVLNKILPDKKQEFHQLIRQLQDSKEVSYILAEINDLLDNATKSELKEMISDPPDANLSKYLENYLAAMVEYGASQKDVGLPSWLDEIKPLDRPCFGSLMMSLRLYLLSHSPSCFRRRNIFIDSSIGQRV